MWCLLTAPAAAQPPGGQPWWLSPSVQSEMMLTSQQVGRLDAIYREKLPARRRLRAQVDELRRQLEQLLAAGPFDDDHDAALVERLFALEKERNVARTLMLVRMYRVLTPDQQTQLAGLSARGAARNGRAAEPWFAFLLP